MFRGAWKCLHECHASNIEKWTILTASETDLTIHVLVANLYKTYYCKEN